MMSSPRLPRPNRWLTSLPVLMLLAGCSNGDGDCVGADCAGDEPSAACTPPAFTAHSADAGTDITSLRHCPNTRGVNQQQVRAGMSLGGLNGNTVVALQSCTLSGDSLRIVAEGPDQFTSPGLQVRFHFGADCGFRGPGTYHVAGKGGLRFDMTPSQYSGAFRPDAESDCSLCLEDDGRTGAFWCKRLKHTDGGTSRLDVGGTFLCP